MKRTSFGVFFYPVLGTALTLALPRDTASFCLTFSTSPAASALQWLPRPETASAQPFAGRSPLPTVLGIGAGLCLGAGRVIAGLGLPPFARPNAE